MKDNKPDWTNDLMGYYDKLMESHGVTPRALDHRDRDQMNFTFGLLCEIGDMKGCSVADIGSGFSDLYQFLKEKEWGGTYTGFEMNERSVKVARERYPETEIIEGEFLSVPVTKKYDWVIMNGSLNIAFEGIEEVAYKMIEKMYDVCNKGVSFNMATSYVDFQKGVLQHYEPEKIFKFCKSLTRYVTLRHDYPIYSFTVYMYKRD